MGWACGAGNAAVTAASESPGEVEGKQECLDQCLQGQELSSVSFTVKRVMQRLGKLSSGTRLGLGETSSRHAQGYLTTS